MVKPLSWNGIESKDKDFGDFLYFKSSSFSAELTQMKYEINIGPQPEYILHIKYRQHEWVTLETYRSLESAMRAADCHHEKLLNHYK